MSMTTDAETPANIVRSTTYLTPLNLKKNGDWQHYTPQTRPQRVAKELLEYVYEEGDKMGEFLAKHPQCFAENGPQAFRILLAWAHNEIEQPPA